MHINQMQNFCFEHENSSFYRTQYSHMQSWIVSLSVCASAGVCVYQYVSLTVCVCMCVCGCCKQLVDVAF